jgi:hypothetical protein
MDVLILNIQIILWRYLNKERLLICQLLERTGGGPHRQVTLKILQTSLGPGGLLREIMFVGSRARQVRRADNLAPVCLDNVGSLTSHNPIGLHGLLRG